MAIRRLHPPTSILRLTVPRDNEAGPEAFEQMLASLHGLLMGEGAKGGISFEIVWTKERILFLVVVPRSLRDGVAAQFYAQYPSGQVELLDDPLPSIKQGGLQLVTGHLRTKRSQLLPLKRYRQFQSKRFDQGYENPLSGMLASLSGGGEETVVVQFIVRPLGEDWNLAARETLERFTQSGLWQMEWFQSFFERLRLGHQKASRIASSWIWGLMIFLLGGTPSKGGDGWDKDRMMIDRDSQTSVLHDRETIYSASFDKVSRLCFSTTIRIAVFGANLPQARTRLRNVVGAFQQFTLPQMNRLVLTCVKAGHGRAFRRLLGRKGFRPFSLSQEEIATLYHLPTKDISIPGIEWVESRHLEPPSGLPTASESGVTVLGNILHRGMGPEYGLRIDDRRRHVYLIGKTGMGKSTLLENMITSDIRNGKGVAVIDPHGDLADAILRLIPRNRTNDVVIFDPSDEAFPVAFNPLDTRNGAPITLLCSGIVGAFKKLHRDSWGPRLEHFLRNTILALLEAENTSMLGIPRMLTDQLYRQRVLRQVHDPVVRSFWDTEFAALAPQKLAEVVGPIQNKVGQFLSSPIIRNIVGQSRSTLDLRFIMDTGKILIVNLSKGKIGEDNSAMLGAMLVTRFQTDAMGRANILEAQRRDFCLYVDEFQNFATESFATILSEARKYRLSLTMANQYLAQMNEDVTAAVFGNVGTLVAFQVGIQDARLLAEQFDESRITPTDLASLPKYDVYNRVMVNGVTTPVFSGRTLPPPMLSPTHRQRLEILQSLSRKRYANPREIVEERIGRWSGFRRWNK